MYRFLRNYRATPHSTTGKSPSELMFSNRPYRTRLPEIKSTYEDTVIREKDRKAKEKMKMYADDHTNVKTSDISVGNTVLVKQNKINKLTPPFNPDPLVVIEKKGSMITAKSSTNNKEIRRNSSFFKRIKNREVVDKVHEIPSEIYESDTENRDENPNRGLRRNPVRQRNRPRIYKKILIIL